MNNDAKNYDGDDLNLNLNNLRPACLSENKAKTIAKPTTTVAATTTVASTTTITTEVQANSSSTQKIGVAKNNNVRQVDCSGPRIADARHSIAAALIANNIKNTNLSNSSSTKKKVVQHETASNVAEDLTTTSPLTVADLPPLRSTITSSSTTTSKTTNRLKVNSNNNNSIALATANTNRTTNNSKNTSKMSKTAASKTNAQSGAAVAAFVTAGTTTTPTTTPTATATPMPASTTTTSAAATTTTTSETATINAPIAATAAAKFRAAIASAPAPAPTPSSSKKQRGAALKRQVAKLQQQQQQLQQQQQQQNATSATAAMGSNIASASRTYSANDFMADYLMGVADGAADRIAALSNSAATAGAMLKKLKDVGAISNAAAAAAAAAAKRSAASSSASSNSSPLSSVGIVNAFSSALQNIITTDTDTDTEFYPQPVTTDLSESEEESVSEILLAFLCLRPDLLDDIPESDHDSCPHDDGEAREDDDETEEDSEESEESEGEDEEEEDEEIDVLQDNDADDEDIDDEDEEDASEAKSFLLESNNKRSSNLTALLEAAANEKAPVLRHATHAIDETKQALTKMRCANSPRDKNLVSACADNDVNTVKRLLCKGNLNEAAPSTDEGESLLSMACSAGYYELAQVLLAMSAAQVEDKGQKDSTPLMEAASAGHLDIVKLLLSHNADVNAHCATGNTPLMFACAGGQVEVVKLLLQHGANVEEQNENGHTPLMEAASAGHVEVARVLLEHGAGINTHSNEFKESALTLACYKGHLDMVRFLLQAGADQEHKTDEMHTALMEASMDGHVEVARLLLDSGAQVNMPTDSFESPLTLAACGGHVELATLLIERGANIEEVNDEGYTPLMEAAREGHEEMVALLLSKGANINATTEETQETALTLACCGGFSEVAAFLINGGANLELGASTPLMEAAQEGHTDLVRFLLQNKANVHAETQTGDTALTHACENGHTDAAGVLLSYGAELEHESEGGRTPLMKACRAGHLCTVKFLIQKGANVNKQTTSNDHTPLSLACAGGHHSVVELLLKNNADPFHKLKDNSTMLIEASKGGHTRVVELLFRYPHISPTELPPTTSAQTVNQIRQQKILQQQIQHQLQMQQLNAPPGLHEVSDAARASNQQLLYQQQFNGNAPSNIVALGTGDFLDAGELQLTAASAANMSDAGATEEYVSAIGNAGGGGIDLTTLSAQQQEGLIAKSRLFHLQPGFEQQQQATLPPTGAQLVPCKHFELDMEHINSLTPPQKAPPAPPVLMHTVCQQPVLQQQQQQKLKGAGSRKNRQTLSEPKPIDLPLETIDLPMEQHSEQVRSQPLGEDDKQQQLSQFQQQQTFANTSSEPCLQRRRGVDVPCKTNDGVSTLDTNQKAVALNEGKLNTLTVSENGAQSSASNAGGSVAITHSSEVLQSTAISDRPKVKASNKNNRKQAATLAARATAAAAAGQPGQNQMASFLNNLQLQQQELQLQQHLQMHHHQQRTASVVDYSNSPASPMASPTGCSANSFADQVQQGLEEADSEALHHKAAMEDFRGLLESAVNESRNGHSLARFNEKIANAPPLKFFKEGWKMHNFFGEQPKSPTETPPEMEETIMRPGMERVEHRAEMKNLATLCSAAAMAAQVTAVNKNIGDVLTDNESDGEANGEENTLPPEPIDLADTIIEEEVVDDDDEDDDDDRDTQSGEIDKLNYDDDDGDAEVDYIDEDDGGDDDDGADDDEDDDDEFFLDVNVAVGDQGDNNSKSSATLRPKSVKMSRLENLILTKPDVLSQSLCDFRQDMPNSELMHMLPIKAAAANNAALNSLLHQQLAVAATAAAVHAKAQSQQQQDNEQGATAAAGELYAGLEHFASDGADGGQYEMEDIFQELASNLHCPELAEFSLNQMCKGRFNGHWSQSSGKWAGQEQLLAAAAAQHSQALCAGDVSADTQQRQANLVLLDYPMQSQRLLDPEELQNLQHQQAPVALLPFCADNAATGVANQQQQQQQQQIHTTLPNNAEFQLQHQAQQITLEGDPELKQQLQHFQHLQQQQHSNARIIKAVAAATGQQQQQPPTANFVYNLENGDKNAPPVQYLYQLPRTMTPQPQQQQQQLTDQSADPLHQQQLLQCEEEQQHMFRQRFERLLQQQKQQKQVFPLPQGLKQKHFNMQEPLLINPPSHIQTPTCVQHQAHTGSVVVPQQFPQFALQQQQQHQQQNPQQQQNELSIWPMSTPNIAGVAAPSGTSKSVPGGIAKKAIDKQSRKDRRCSGFRQTPAGSQVNTNQHHQQPVTTASTSAAAAAAAAAAQQQAQLQNQQAVATAAAVDKTIEIDSETESNHDTALTLACAGGHEELCELLISRGANIEHRDKKGFTPLILAATAGHEKVVETLLKNNADLEAQSERTKDTPLSLACSGGRYEVVELLLGVGSNKEHRNVSDYTPLSLAASGGYVNIIKLLLNHGAEINSRTGSKLGISPLMLAAMNGHTAAVKLLLDQGSDINAQIETNRNTALTLACFQGRHEVVSLLLDRRANVEHRAKTGLTPLMEAASGGYIEVGRVLLDKGADVNAAPVPTSRDTALTIAADKGHLKFVELLLSRGASVEVKNKKGNSPLWLAAHGGHLSVVELLYNHNADIDSQDNRRVSCLMAAYRKGHTKIVKWMVQYVSQFPSDQEMIRFIGTISDKELIEKCYDCMKILRAAKEAQAVKANKNASILLEELDLERTREESRKAAAARRRERKKKKKMEKKEEKRRQQQVGNGPNGDDDQQGDDDDGSENDKDDDTDKDEDDEEAQPVREEGDSGIDQGSCSSGDTKAARVTSNQDNVNINGNGNSSNKKSKKQQQKNKMQQQIQSSEAATTSPAIALVASTPNGKSGTVAKKLQAADSAKQPSICSSQTAGQQPKRQSDAKKEELIAVTSSSVNPTAISTANSSKKATKETNSNKREKENLAPKESIPAQKPQAPGSASKLQPSSNDLVSNISTRKDSGKPNNATASSALAKRSEVDGWKEVVRKSSAQQTAIVASVAGGAPSVGTSSVSSSNVTPNNSTTSVNSGSTGQPNVVSTSSSSSLATTVPEMTCKKVQVPVNAISRVIGRAGSNINAIRATTGAHIEVEKQGKNQSERSITIKGLTDATKQAHMLILSLIKDPDVDILQMLPRINSSIKAGASSGAVTPTTTIATQMTVGTWDNRTAAVGGSGTTTVGNYSSAASTTSSSSSSSASSTPAAAFSNAKQLQQVAVSGPKTQSGRGGTAKSNAAGGKSSTSARGQGGRAYSGSSQQPSVRGAISSSANGIPPSQSSKTKQDTSSTLKSLSTFTNQKSSAASTQGKSLQSYGMKAVANVTQSPKKVDGVGAVSGRSSGGVVVAPFGRGKPVASCVSSISQLGNNNNTLAGPIGTFNVADVAAVNAAAAAAAASANNTSSSNNNNNNSNNNVNVNNGNDHNSKSHSVTSIAPPTKRIASPVQQNLQQQQKPQQQLAQQQLQSSPTLQQQQAQEQQQQQHQNQQQQQEQQQLHQQAQTQANNNQNLVINTNALNDIIGDSFSAQLAAKLSNAYSLFSDYQQSQWGKLAVDSSTAGSGGSTGNAAGCGINTMVGDVLPQADASKAPGYNRNILSSPVGSSKASSNHSSSPPVGGAAIPMQQQQSQQQPQNNQQAVQQALNIITSVAGGNVAAARSPLAADPGTTGSGVVASSGIVGIVNGSQDHGDGNNVSAHSPGVIKPPTAPIQRPTLPIQMTPAAESTTGSNFGSSNATIIDRQVQDMQRLQRLYDKSGAQQQSHNNYPMEHSGLHNMVDGIMRLNRASVYSQGNKSQQPAPTGGNQQQPNMFPNQGRQAPGARQPSVGGAAAVAQQRWYGGALEYPAYSGRDMLHLENGGGLAGLNSPSAMSPNHDDIRKMPRPIGTERAAASWKYNNYNVAATALSMNDALINVVPWVHEPKPPQPPGLQQQQSQQPPNWLKQHYRPYNNGPYPQHDPMNMQMDYHNMQQQAPPPPPQQQQQQHVNLMPPSYGFQHFVGAHGAADIPSHLPDKVEAWEHHEKHQPWANYTTNWSN